MAKTTFACHSCNQEFFKWQGCCPNCQNWNSITEKISTKSSFTASTKVLSVAILTEQANITIDEQRISSQWLEWDRAFGGGIVRGSVNILTGDPGIGKSTLLLQIAHQIAQTHHVIYFSSEESTHQVAARARRILGQKTKLYFLAENNLDLIINTIIQERPDLVIIDAIQNCFLENSPHTNNSINQIRECGFKLMQLAKSTNAAIILTAHITKDGQMAGPKTLEHLVDTVFYLQGEDHWQVRILRSIKNRFGPTNELGFFEMAQTGLHELTDINKLLLENSTPAPGATLISYLEGSRPLLLELQALTLPSKLNLPQRVITGIEHIQVILIAAILEKYLKIKFSQQDIFFKVSSDFKIRSNSSDLGIALALLSSYMQTPLKQKTVTLGELSLTGKIKPIQQIGPHLKEAERFGIEQCIVPKQNLNYSSNMNLVAVENIYELLQLLE